MIDFPRLIRALLGKPEPLPEPIPELLKDWDDLILLTGWANAHYTLVPGDCDDLASYMIEQAQLDGYRLSWALVGDGLIYHTQVLPAGADPPNDHAATLARIGTNEMYYFDPMFRVIIKLTNLD